jgi:NTE family protein
MEKPVLAQVPLFEGLGETALAEVYGLLQRRHFEAREFICREGEPGDSLFIIENGMAQVMLGAPDSPGTVARLYRGDVVGEMALLTGDARSASVQATVPTEALELSREALTRVMSRHPTVLANLSRILSRRLARANRRLQERRRAEVVALVLDAPASALAARLIEATRAASPRPVAALDLTGTLPLADIRLEQQSVPAALAALEELLPSHAAAIIVAYGTQADLPRLLEHVDRAVFAGRAAGARALAAGWGAGALEVVLFREAGQPAARGALAPPGGHPGLRVVRAVDPEPSAADVAWLGRHLARTKIGLALGAGGSRSYAHVGALQVLQEAGYVVDCVAGTSIGAVVGAWLASGMDAREIEATMRRFLTPERVDALFRPAAGALNPEAAAGFWREVTQDRFFRDLPIPLVVMAADLNAQVAVPIVEGPVWEALLAGTALPGLLPPHEQGKKRLVDGTALVPVPTRAVSQVGADITVAINLNHRNTFASWPAHGGLRTADDGRQTTDQGVAVCRLPSAVPSPQSAIDTLLEVMDLAQLDAGARQAALADLVIAPRFGPSHWRDFHLADLFLAAGRRAAEEQLPALRALTQPARAEPPRVAARPLEPLAVSDILREAPAATGPFTFEEFREILARLVGTPESRLPNRPEASFAEIGLDSIDFLEAQIEIEQRYRLRIPWAEAATLQTIGETISYVNQRLQEAQPG